jgi:hypothetical protein
MSRDGSTVLSIGGRDRLVRLAIGEWAKLQETLDAGPPIIVDRLYSAKWKVDDLVAVLRYGLEGGGVEPVEALRIARDTIGAQPLLDSLLCAQRILQVAYAGPVDEPPKKDDGPTESASTISPTGNSASDHSSAQPI